MKDYFHKYLISLFFLGLALRLIASFSATHFYDFFNILNLAKSVADTGNLIDGFFDVGNIQLYGKIYYQVIAVWLLFLNAIHLIDLRYILLGSEHYQVTSIKLVQLFYDVIILFFLLEICRVLKLKNYFAIVLFWAINPLFIYVGYVIFQSDLAMLAAFTGGVYFALRSLTSEKKSIVYGIFAMTLLALGAVIKQVPLLFAPVVLFALSKTPKLLFIYSVAFTFFYLLFSQPWSIDALIIKRHFFTSEESRAVFNFSLNGMTMFFVAYALFLFLFFKTRNFIQKQPITLVYIVTLLISLIYLVEDSGALFVQFSIWIMPFLAILALHKRIYSVFFVIPIIIFFKRALADTAVMTGSLAMTFGEPLYFIRDYREYINNVIPFDLFISFLSTLLGFALLLLIFYLVRDVLKKRTETFLDTLAGYMRLSLVTVSIGLFLIFVAVGIFEYSISSFSSRLTNYEFETPAEKIVTLTPSTFTISNKNKHYLTGFDLNLKAKNISENDSLVITVKDNHTKNVILRDKIHDYSFANIPVEEEIVFIPLSRPLNAESLTVTLAKEKGKNEIVLKTANKVFQKHHSLLGNYDVFYNDKSVQTQASGSALWLNVRGIYPPNYLYSHILSAYYKKPSFYTMYFGVISILLVSSIVLFVLGIRDSHNRK